jgi:hypothetical protein
MTVISYALRRLNFAGKIASNQRWTAMSVINDANHDDTVFWDEVAKETKIRWKRTSP